MADISPPKCLVKLTVQTDGVAILLFDRPEKRNALSHSMIDEFIQHLVELEGDDAVRAVVVTGSPGGPFSSGADLKELINISTTEAYERRYLGNLTDALMTFSKPIIASVEGYALGGGFEVALMCDIIYASEDAFFGLPEVKIGTMPGAGGTQHLAKIIGKYKAMELVLTGESVSSREFERLGVVNKIFSSEMVLGQACNLATRIAAMSGPVTRSIKKAVIGASENHLTLGVEAEKSLYYNTFDLDDCKEGISAFLGKRPAKFEHK